MPARARNRAARRTPAVRAPLTDATIATVDPGERVASIDALRGLAIVAMIVYHFAFDLRYFGLTRADFENDPFWLTARGAIVTSFLLLAGISAVLADRAGIGPRRFARRIAVIALCALAASAASYALFPQTFIYFGILHCIAVSLVIARPLVRHATIAVVAGCAVIVAGLLFSHPWFDARQTSWIGFTTHKPPTQDFVPLFPWLGVVLLGIGVGHALVAMRFGPVRALERAPRLLRTMGRHSLVIYMVHQPVLMSFVWLALRLAH